MIILRQIKSGISLRTLDANVFCKLNESYKCPVCHTSHNWYKTARSITRENSIIGNLACELCGEMIITKVPLFKKSSICDKNQGLNEYRILKELLHRFPQDERYGTLIPLGYLDQYGVIITKKVDAKNLSQYVFSSNTAAPLELYYCAGVWLRKLHDVCPRGYQSSNLDTENKLNYLEQSYVSVLRTSKVAYSIYEHLLRLAPAVGATPLRMTWNHGDYKPENILYDGKKYIGVDTKMEHYNAFVYDIASFLNHLLIAGQSIKGNRIRQCYLKAAEQFLMGYGDINELDRHIIWWAQLYFMLCYWGRYQIRNKLSAIYSNWHILPLLEELNMQL